MRVVGMTLCIFLAGCAGNQHGGSLGHLDPAFSFSVGSTVVYEGSEHRYSIQLDSLTQVHDLSGANFTALAVVVTMTDHLLPAHTTTVTAFLEPQSGREIGYMLPCVSMQSCIPYYTLKFDVFGIAGLFGLNVDVRNLTHQVSYQDFGQLATEVFEVQEDGKCVIVAVSLRGHINALATPAMMPPQQMRYCGSRVPTAINLAGEQLALLSYKPGIGPTLRPWDFSSQSLPNYDLQAAEPMPSSLSHFPESDGIPDPIPISSALEHALRSSGGVADFMSKHVGAFVTFSADGQRGSTGSNTTAEGATQSVSKEIHISDIESAQSIAFVVQRKSQTNHADVYNVSKLISRTIEPNLRPLNALQADLASAYASAKRIEDTDYSKMVATSVVPSASAKDIGPSYGGGYIYFLQFNGPSVGGISLLYSFDVSSTTGQLVQVSAGPSISKLVDSHWSNVAVV